MVRTTWKHKLFGNVILDPINFSKVLRSTILFSHWMGTFCASSIFTMKQNSYCHHNRFLCWHLKRNIHVKRENLQTKNFWFIIIQKKLGHLTTYARMNDSQGYSNSQWSEKKKIIIRHKSSSLNLFFSFFLFCERNNREKRKVLQNND